MFAYWKKRLLRCLRRYRAAARLRHASRPAGEGDPRDIQRIEDELRQARELARLQVTRGRLLW